VGFTFDSRSVDWFSFCLCSDRPKAESNEIVHVLPPMDNWIVGGHFNNIESPSDYHALVPPHLSEISPAEIDAWDAFRCLVQAIVCTLSW